MGYCYQNGIGVEINYPKALEWYQKAANKGNAVAQDNLGNMYEFGLGVKQDYQKATEWYLEAVKQGDEEALIHLQLLNDKIKSLIKYN